MAKRKDTKTKEPANPDAVDVYPEVEGHPTESFKCSICGEEIHYDHVEVHEAEHRRNDEDFDGISFEPMPEEGPLEGDVPRG